MKGVINLRGLIIPLIDMNKLLKYTETDITDDTRIIIVNINDLVLGLLVDEANEIAMVEEIDDSNDLVQNNEIIGGVFKTDNGLVSLLDIEKLLNV